jgi:hypothetical protein
MCSNSRWIFVTKGLLNVLKREELKLFGANKSERALKANKT